MFTMLALRIAGILQANAEGYGEIDASWMKDASGNISLVVPSSPTEHQANETEPTASPVAPCQSPPEPEQS
jgi:hypothetical protein